MICAANGCQFIYKWQGDGKGILTQGLNKKKKQKKKNLAARLLFNIGTGWTVNKYTFSVSQKGCHEHWKESCFEAELQTRLRLSKGYLY